MAVPEPISYREASAMLFINAEKKDTHVFIGSIGCCWPTAKVRKEMRRSQLYFCEPYCFGGHRIVAVTPERTLRIETHDKKVARYLAKKGQ